MDVVTYLRLCGCSRRSAKVPLSECPAHRPPSPPCTTRGVGPPPHCGAIHQPLRQGPGHQGEVALLSLSSIMISSTLQITCPVPTWLLLPAHIPFESPFRHCGCASPTTMGLRGYTPRSSVGPAVLAFCEERRHSMMFRGCAILPHGHSARIDTLFLTRPGKPTMETESVSSLSTDA